MFTFKQLTEVEVIVPLNVSGVWYPIRGSNLLTTGSIGISLTLDPPIIASARVSSEPVIELNGDVIKLKHLEILRSLGSLKLDIRSPVKLGYGYGLSGAISLAYALSTAHIYNVNLNRALDTAHIAEVVNETGLGDVVSEYYGGGILYRKKPGSPTVAEVEVFKVKGEVCSKPVEALPTRAIIKEFAAALDLIQEFLKSPSLVKFFEVSKRFSTYFGHRAEEGLTFRKKGLLLSLDRCGDGWTKHTVANHGAFVR